MANYPMIKKVLVLDEADKDQIERVIVAHQLPPSNRMRTALAEAFKIGYNQRNTKEPRVA
jgi:hypothetical protein